MAPTTSVSPSGAMASNTPTTGSNPVDSTTPVPDGLAGEGTKESTITELIDKFDTAKYFKVCWSLIPFQLCYTTNLMNTFVLQDHGKENFLIISILARVYLSRFETGAESRNVCFHLQSMPWIKTSPE